MTGNERRERERLYKQPEILLGPFSHVEPATFQVSNIWFLVFRQTSPGKIPCPSSTYITWPFTDPKCSFFISSDSTAGAQGWLEKWRNHVSRVVLILTQGVLMMMIFVCIILKLNEMWRFVFANWLLPLILEEHNGLSFVCVVVGNMMITVREHREQRVGLLYGNIGFLYHFCIVSGEYFDFFVYLFFPCHQQGVVCLPSFLIHVNAA